ncbi:MAG TPA: prenyltransferase/squalene oxidase repeat-containing protein [Conexibacter sp.]|jgi:energy-coupling factor transport system substrate-specific component|nr:prenyltransferase/squalene oxidase repeat-containing protein [Conexibacter sp.]
MSWQLASSLLLALALAGGFAWYERSHPSARVLALVGTLAALAVLGRIAFAPVPNVKPTTDIVLLAGYVFGGAPGFAVGAVAALASNLFFTQGPWTPWQMAAWGAIGVGGAGLARVSRGRLGRVPLALACGLAGLVYGAILNFGSVVTFGGGDLGHRYLLYQTTSLPWDLAHAAGNVVFFLLFGPALVRTLRRFRTRLSFTWQSHPAGLAAALAAAVLLAGAAGPAAAPARAATPAQYLAHAQNADGGFGSAPGSRSAGLYTGWATIALATQRGHRAAMARAVGWVRAHAAGLARNGSATDVGDLERTVLLLAAAGRSPRAFARQDLVAALTRRIGGDGTVLGQVNLTTFAILALRAAGVRAQASVLHRAGGWLARQQNGDGGFGFLTRGFGSDVDDTAAALQALAVLGGRRPALRRGAAYIERVQNADGGLPQQRGGSSNAMSTAWAIQGLVAAGVPLSDVRRGGAATPLAYLRSLTAPNGAVRYSRTSTQTPVWVTAYAVLALARRPLPVTP